MSILNTLLILLAGTAAGFINTLAGGGSLITLPLLITLGLPSAVANGTNRIAILIQNITALGNFKHKGYFDYKLGLLFAIPAVVGSIIGANLAITLPDDTFNTILAVVMIIMVILIIWNPSRKSDKIIEKLTGKRRIISVILLFFVGIYGGFIQAGVGYFIIGSITLLTGFSLVKTNSLKVFIITFYTFFSLFIFIVNGKIDWIMGLTLAVGNSLGAWLGSTLAVNKGEKLVKIVLAVGVVIMAGNLLGLY